MSTQGATTCYAVVTTGEEWQFGKFEKERALFTKQIHKLSVFDEYDEPGNLQKLFDTLNWLFERAGKVEVVRNAVS